MCVCVCVCVCVCLVKKLALDTIFLGLKKGYIFLDSK